MNATNVRNLDSAIRRLNTLSRTSPQAARTEVRRALLRIQNAAKRLCPVRFGALRNSITHVVDDDELGGTVGTNTPYAPYVEFGTKAHLIEPKNASVLRFKVGDRVVYARSVQHPGTRAQPYLFPAFESEIAPFNQRLQARLIEVLKEQAVK